MDPVDKRQRQRSRGESEASTAGPRRQTGLRGMCCSADWGLQAHSMLDAEGLLIAAGLSRWIENGALQVATQRRHMGAGSCMTTGQDPTSPKAGLEED